jgi:hypothetical protein
MGVKLTDEAVVERLFSAVPERFGDIVNTIKQWGDVMTMSVAEATGRLTAYKNQHRRGRDRGDGDKQLMLVTRALESLMKGKKGGDGGRGSSSSGTKKNVERDRRQGEHGETAQNNCKDRGKGKKHRKFDISKVRCFNCDE